jgi:hypothetical protein
MKVINKQLEGGGITSEIGRREGWGGGSSTNNHEETRKEEALCISNMLENNE